MPIVFLQGRGHSFLGRSCSVAQQLPLAPASGQLPGQPRKWCPCPQGACCGRLQIVPRGAPVDSRACALSWSQSIRGFPGDRTLGLSQSPWPLPQAI